MKSFFRLILLALVLVVVALVSALIAIRLAIHGHEVIVPEVLGKSPAVARLTAEQAGLDLTVERQYYSPTVPEGRILSQLPPAGIRVAESLGPQRVVIPNVLGQSERAANINIRRRGLDVGSIAQVDVPDAPEGQILAQAPPANASGVSAPKISLLIAAAPQSQALVMPNFVGQQLGSATQALQDAGLRVGTVAQASSETSTSALPPTQRALVPSATNVIVSQNPPAGEKVTTGVAVNFEVR